MSRPTKAKLPPFSRQFFEFIRAIGECKSKQNEQRVLQKELSLLRANLSMPNNTPTLIREFLIRTLYCEMLGYPVEFAHIHALQLIPNADPYDKRVGYLVAGSALGADNPMTVLIVSTILKDLKSSSFISILCGLHGCSKLIGKEVIECVLPQVEALLYHSNPEVRKRAVLAIHTFYKIDPQLIASQQHRYRNVLSDCDPRVMGASLCLFHDLTLTAPESQRCLAGPLICILRQIVEHRLSKEYDYHRIPAPWLQIKILQILKYVVSEGDANVANCTELASEIRQRSDTGLNIGYALMFEAIKALTCVNPRSRELESASHCISVFLKSPNPNLVYLGICALGDMARIDSAYAAPHQLTVIECLEAPDVTIQRKTIELLYAMTSHINVEVITNKLCRYIMKTNDKFQKAQMVRKTCELARRYGRDRQWYVRMMTQLMKIGGKYIEESSLQALQNVMCSGRTKDDDDEVDDDTFRKSCLQRFVNILDGDGVYHENLYRIIGWVIGEFAQLKEYTATAIINRLTDLISKPHTKSTTRANAVVSLMKLCARDPMILTDPKLRQQIADIVIPYTFSRDTNLQQWATEFKVIAQRYPELLNACMPTLEESKNLEFDSDLRFLDGLIDDFTSRGYKQYQKRFSGADEEAEGKLRFTAYEAPDELRKGDDEECAVSFAVGQELVVGKRIWGITAELEEAENEIATHSAFQTTVNRWNSSSVMEDEAVDEGKRLEEKRRKKKEREAQLLLYGTVTEDPDAKKKKRKKAKSTKGEKSPNTVVPTFDGHTKSVPARSTNVKAGNGMGLGAAFGMDIQGSPMGDGEDSLPLLTTQPLKPPATGNMDDLFGGGLTLRGAAQKQYAMNNQFEQSNNKEWSENRSRGVSEAYKPPSIPTLDLRRVSQIQQLEMNTGQQYIDVDWEMSEEGPSDNTQQVQQDAAAAQEAFAHGQVILQQQQQEFFSQQQAALAHQQALIAQQQEQERLLTQQKIIEPQHSVYEPHVAQNIESEEANQAKMREQQQQWDLQQQMIYNQQIQAQLSAMGQQQAPTDIFGVTKAQSPTIAIDSPSVDMLGSPLQNEVATPESLMREQATPPSMLLDEAAIAAYYPHPLASASMPGGAVQVSIAYNGSEMLLFVTVQPQQFNALQVLIRATDPLYSFNISYIGNDQQPYAVSRGELEPVYTGAIPLFSTSSIPLQAIPADPQAFQCILNQPFADGKVYSITLDVQLVSEGGPYYSDTLSLSIGLHSNYLVLPLGPGTPEEFSEAWNEGVCEFQQRVSIAPDFLNTTVIEQSLSKWLNLRTIAVLDEECIFSAETISLFILSRKAKKKEVKSAGVLVHCMLDRADSALVLTSRSKTRGADPVLQGVLGFAKSSFEVVSR